MNIEFPFYTKEVWGEKNGFSHTLITEIDKNSYVDIHKTTHPKYEPARCYEVRSSPQSLTDKENWHESYLNHPNLQATQSDFNELKNEFLNWVDQTFKK